MLSFETWKKKNCLDASVVGLRYCHLTSRRLADPAVGVAPISRFPERIQHLP